jgi:hypothetical protein
MGSLVLVGQRIGAEQLAAVWLTTEKWRLSLGFTTTSSTASKDLGLYIDSSTHRIHSAVYFSSTSSSRSAPYSAEASHKILHRSPSTPASDDTPPPATPISNPPQRQNVQVGPLFPPSKSPHAHRLTASRTEPPNQAHPPSPPPHTPRPSNSPRPAPPPTITAPPSPRSSTPSAGTTAPRQRVPTPRAGTRADTVSSSSRRRATTRRARRRSRGECTTARSRDLPPAACTTGSSSRMACMAAEPNRGPRWGCALDCAPVAACWTCACFADSARRF